MLTAKDVLFLRYTNIEDVMARINTEEILSSIGFRITRRNSEWLTGYCPDHFNFTGRHPSHPKWRVNLRTGETYCFTESRKSGLVFVIARALDISQQAAFDILAGDLETISHPLRFAVENFRKRDNAPPDAPEKDPNKNETLNSMRGVIEEGYRANRLYDYFGKYGIRRDTVCSFGLVEMLWGKYRDRTVVPFYNIDGTLMGFVAVDLLGKRVWVREHAEYITNEKKDLTYPQFRELIYRLHACYKKALYCPNVPTGNHLYGFHRLLRDGTPDEVILVEGEKDVLKLQQEGFPAVGTHGAHCTEEQRLLLRKHGIKKTIVVFDGDEAGWRNGRKVVKALDKDGFEATEVQLPEGLDPKDYNRSTFAQVLQKARPCTVGFLTQEASEKLLKMRQFVRREEQ